MGNETHFLVGAGIATATVLIGPTALIPGMIGAVAYCVIASRKKEKTPEETEPKQAKFIHTKYSPSLETEIKRPVNQEKVNKEMLQVLERDNARKSYNKALSEGAQVTNDYISKLSSEELAKIRKIKIYPEQQLNVLGVPLGRKSLEIKIKR